MLNHDETIDFVGEVLRSVEDFLQAYEEVCGPPRDSLERSLVISYALGTLRDDLESVWEALAASPELAALDPRDAFEELVQLPATSRERKAEIVRMLQERGWLSAH